MEDKKVEFAQGIIFEKPREGAPEWIKGRISVRVEIFHEWARQHVNQNGFVNMDLKKSKEKGTLYLQLNSWKPTPKADPAMGEVTQPLVDIKPDTMTSPGYKGEPAIDVSEQPF